MSFVVKLISAAFAGGLAFADQPLIVLDPGHTPSSFGAEGACGSREVDLNDAASKVIQARLQNSAAYKVQLTREYQKDIIPTENTHSPIADRESTSSLLRRSAIANEANAGVFISIHHDSVEPRYLVEDANMCRGRGGVRISNDFKKRQKIGYNIFVYQGGNDNKARFEASKTLAQLIAKHMQASGMVASDFHQKPIEMCETCRPLDAALGVWNQDLVVLKRTQMPAILIESQNTADPELEQVASSPEFREKLAGAIKEGLDEYYASDAPAAYKKAEGSQAAR